MTWVVAYRATVEIFHGVETGARYGMDFQGLPKRMSKRRVREVAESFGLHVADYIDSKGKNLGSDVYWKQDKNRVSLFRLDEWRGRRHRLAPKLTPKNVLHHLSFLLMMLTGAKKPRIKHRELARLYADDGAAHELVHVSMGLMTLKRWLSMHRETIRDMESRLPELFGRE